MASHRAILIQCQSVNGGPRPPDDVAEADQSVEQRAKDERLPTMHRISIARRSKMLIDCLLAYSKDGGNFGLGLAASRPEDAFSLALAQDWTLAHGRDPDDPPRAGQCKGADNFGDMKHFARDLPVRTEEHTSELQSLMRISYAV